MTKQTQTIHVETKKMQFLKQSEWLWESLVSFIFSFSIKHMVTTGKSSTSHLADECMQKWKDLVDTFR